MKKITLEFDESFLSLQKKVRNKKAGGRAYSYKNVPVNNPKAWEVIMVENSSTYSPGQRLSKQQVQTLCRGRGYDVAIGQPGQFRKTNSRY